MKPSDRPRNIPHVPGVYRFSNAAGAVIYIGKAKDLANRLANYFASPDTLHPRTAAMVKEATSVTWLELASEQEALLVEQQLISANQPRYNVRLRAHDAYPVVVITKEEFPRVYLTHNPPPGADIFGPYPATKQLGVLVENLVAALQLRGCRPGVYKTAIRTKRPCLLYELGRCSAPCISAIDKKSYDEQVDTIRSVLVGKDRNLAATLSAQMQRLAAAREYEEAARLRDLLKAIDSIATKDQLDLPASLNCDVLATSLGPASTALAVLVVRHGRLVAFHSSVVSTEELLDSALDFDQCADPTWHQRASLAATLAYYREHEPAPLVLTDVELPELAPALAALSPENRAPKVQTPKRALRYELLTRAIAHAKDVARRTLRPQDHAERSAAILELQSALDLPAAPLRIECYDNAHLQTTNYVGSMVVFVDGVPRPAHYRSFSFEKEAASANTPQVGDDLSAMRTMLTRRLRHLTDAPVDDPSLSITPDLLLIDGGPTQLATVQEVLVDLGLDIPVAALAKRFEELYLPGRKEPIRLPADSKALYLVQRLRDEAHRRANTHHAKRRAKSMTNSTLDQVKGLGPARQARLLAEYSSVTRLRTLSLSELKEISYLPTAVASTLYTALHPDTLAPPASPEVTA